MGLIIIAGPQASGKTTAISVIFNNYKNIIPYKEASKIIIEKNKLIGAAFVGDFEEEIHKLNAERIKNISKGKIHVMESVIFSLAHPLILGKIGIYNNFYPLQKKILEELNAGVLFIDVAPRISWQRRKEEYEKRVKSNVEKEEILKKYKGHIENAYSILLKMYGKLNLPKIKINGNVDEIQFEERVKKSFERLCERMALKV